jgi:hypothetical protein
VPDFANDGNLSSSTLILADLLEPVPARDTGSGVFVIGPNRVRPRVPPANGGTVSIHRGETVNLWLQIYNLVFDEKTGKPSTSVEYRVINTATNQAVYSQTEDAGSPAANDRSITIKKTLPAGTLMPGAYQVMVTIHDLNSKQTLTSSARFAIN